MGFELLLIALFAFASVVPLWAARKEGGWRRRAGIGALLALGVGLTGGFLAGMGRRGYDPVAVEATVTNRPLRVPANKYIGSDTCRSCHTDKHASWYDSYHRTMTQVATPEAFLGDIDKAVFSDGTRTMRLVREGDRFFADVEAPHPRVPGQMATLRQPIVMTTGSHHMQAYWTNPKEKSRLLSRLSYVYLIEEERWVPHDASFLTGRFHAYGVPGEWNQNCVHCHATRGAFRNAKQQFGFFETETFEARATEFGISCESCHGPGHDHVAAYQNPVARYKQHLAGDSNSTIVNPAKLPHDRSSHVCGKCHSISLTYTDVEEHATKTPDGWMSHDFQPGKDLHESRVRFVVGGDIESVPERERHQFDSDPDFFVNRYWSDGMVRVAGREYNGLMESPCFQRGELSCLSCHQLHQLADDPRDRKDWANDQLKLDHQTNQACIQCHEQFRDSTTLTQHTHHLADSSGSNCYNCHMPHTTYGLLKAIRSHEIDSPDVAVTVATGRVTACNQCHLDKSLGWTGDHLAEWYGIEKPELPPEEEQIASSVLMLLRGDAGQRALMAWSYGWEDALEASGNDWQAPFVSQLLEDPYAAVRLIAHRSLRRLPGLADHEYDLLGDQFRGGGSQTAHPHWVESHQRALAIWNEPARRAQRVERPQILIGADGNLLTEELQRLLEQRDDRMIDLQE